MTGFSSENRISKRSMTCISSSTRRASVNDANIESFFVENVIAFSSPSRYGNKFAEMVKLKIVDGIHKLSTQRKFQTRVHLRNELSRHSGSSQVAKCSFLMLRAQSSDKRCAAMRSAWEKTPENWQSVVQKGTNVVNNKPKWWDLSPYESYQLKKEKKKSQIMPGKRT